jgi:hypothetical protein
MFLILAPAESEAQVVGINGPIEASPNGHYFVDQSGTPFFWLGDTSWRLFVDFDQTEVETYLQTRRDQGFTVVQAIAALWGGSNGDPNPAGQRPWLNNNPATPNDAFFQNVDYIVNLANEYGLVVAFSPVNGDFITNGVVNINNARAYGRWVGQRYRNTPNIIWVNGGDVSPSGKKSVWREVAAGLKEGDGGAHLITFHPPGGNSSSTPFHQDSWLSFDMIQTWNEYGKINQMIARDYSLTPAKPTGLGEGAYEAGTQYPGTPVVTPLIVRKQAYWSYLSGGYHTYGHNDVMLKTANWQSGMTAQGAKQLTVLKNLFTSIQWSQLAPDQSLFSLGANSGTTLNTAARSSSGNLAVVYLSSQTTVGINMSKLSSGNVTATWIDPVTGTRTPAGTYPNVGVQSFTTPSSSTDAVLLLEAGATPAPTPAPTPTVGTSAVFVNTDTTTQGNWKGKYGQDGYRVAYDSTNYPAFAQVNLSGYHSHIWKLSTSDVRAMQKGAPADRIASTWFANSPFYIDVNMLDANAHQVALYCLDWDNGGRTQTIDVLDAASGAVLNTRTVSGFRGGKYLIWNVTGHVQFRVTNTDGVNGVVSGLFFN